MTTRRITFKLKSALLDEFISDAEDIASHGSNVESLLGTLLNTAFDVRRPFLPFRESIIITNSNAATYANKNLIYVESSDKTNVDITFPHDAHIQAAGLDYPVVIQVTHLGGTGVFATKNRIRLWRRETTPVNVTRIFGVLQRNQIAVLTKESSDTHWKVNTSTFEAGEALLRQGVFNLKTDMVISSIAEIGTLLEGVTIVAGDSYSVAIGGQWSGMAVPDNSILIAVSSGASLEDSEDNHDWVVIGTGRLSTKSMLFIQNIMQENTRFNMNDNITVAPSNVKLIDSTATGGFEALDRINLSSAEDAPRQFTFEKNIQFSSISKGTLTTSLLYIESSTGFAPVLTNLSIRFADDYVLPLNPRIDNAGGLNMIETPIPARDWSEAINKNITLIYDFTFTGVSAVIDVTVESMSIHSEGRLYQPVRSIVDTVNNALEAKINTQLTDINRRISAEGEPIENLENRISPEQIITTRTSDINTYYLSSTPGQTAPIDLAQYFSVSATNPVIRVNSTQFFIALKQDGIPRILINHTQNLTTPIPHSSDISAAGSILSGGVTYFIYLVENKTANDTFEVAKQINSKVIAWAVEIERLESAVELLKAQISTAVRSLPDGVSEILHDNVSVTFQDNLVFTATDFNKSFSNTNEQTVFMETAPVTELVNNVKLSEPFNTQTSNLANRKIVYLPGLSTLTSQVYLYAYDGTTERDLIRERDGIFQAAVKIPGIPSGQREERVYPATPLHYAGEGVWQTLETLTISGGTPSTENSELLFTRNVPTHPVDVRVQFRGHANGNVISSSELTLEAAGGITEVSNSFRVTSGGETVDCLIAWQPYANRFKVSAIPEPSYRGFPTIQNVQVILSWVRTINVPAIPESVRWVDLERPQTIYPVFLLGPDDENNLVIAGRETQINTGYAFTELVGSDRSGHMGVRYPQTEYLNYRDFSTTNANVVLLKNRAEAPYHGLFDANIDHESQVTLDAQFIVKDDKNAAVNVGVNIVNLNARVAALESQ